MKNNLLLTIIISTFVALIAGFAAALFINTQSSSFYDYFGAGPELNLNQYEYMSPGLIIQEPRKVVVNQDVKIEETASSVRASILKVFAKQATVNYAYNLDSPLAHAVVATTDGWVMALWPEDPRLEQEDWENNYVLIDSNNQIYEIEQIVISPKESDWLIFFKLSNANSLPVRRLVAESEIRAGQSVLLFSAYDNIALDFLSGKQILSTTLSSDSQIYSLALSINSAVSPYFVFNLSGDIVAVRDVNDNWILAPEIDTYWRSLFVDKEINQVFLGINYLDLSRNILDQQSNKGALITAVVADSPADIAGLQKGDVILKVNNLEINQNQNLSLLIQSYRPGDRITLTYQRDEILSDVAIVLASQ